MRFLSVGSFRGRCIHLGLLRTSLVLFPGLLCADPSQGTAGDVGWRDQVRAELATAEYHFQTLASEPGVWSAPNRGQSLRTRVCASGLSVFPREVSESGAEAPWTLSLRSISIGRGEDDLCLGEARVVAEGERVELHHPGLVEWFVNEADGLEHGWSLLERPAGQGALRIGLEVEGGFVLEVDEEGTGTFVHPDAGVELPYHGLYVVDARGRSVPARLLGGEHPGILVEDEGYDYPLIVDPYLNGPDWWGQSNQEFGHYGWSVASAGDVNGDGYDDVLVGASTYDDGQIDEGKVWLYLGSLQGLGIAAWSLGSDVAGAKYGSSVASAGDVNGDGYDDVIVGAPELTNPEAHEGGVWVYHGSSSGLATTAWFVDSDQPGILYGAAVASAGDVNGDGYDDVLVGAPGLSQGQTDEGGAWLYHGSSVGLTHSDWYAQSNQAGAKFGTSLAGVGDVNNDGKDDVMIGAPLYDNGETNEGRVWFYLGSTSGISTSVWSAESNQQSARFGAVVAAAGDVNGDGYDDVVVSAPSFDDGETNEGRIWVYHGTFLGLLDSTWSAQGDQEHAGFGSSVASAGDIDGDGYDDLVVSAPAYDDTLTNEGRVWLYRGSAGGVIHVPAWTRSGGQSSSFYGHRVASAGDVDGDGYDDVVVGAPFFDNGQTDEGLAWVYGGCARQGVPFCLALPNSTGAQALITAWCSPSASQGDLRLEAGPVPQQPGVFFHGASTVVVPFGNGYRCAAGEIVRSGVVTPANGVASLIYSGGAPSLSLLPHVGTTRYFQYWYRDPAAGGHQFNLSNGVGVHIEP